MKQYYLIAGGTLIAKVKGEPSYVRKPVVVIDGERHIRAFLSDAVGWSRRYASSTGMQNYAVEVSTGVFLLNKDSL